MGKEKDIETTTAFYGQLFYGSKYVLLVLLIASVVELYAMPSLDASYVTIIILVLTLMKIIAQSHLLSHVLVLFGYLIVLVIFSFAIDFTALQFLDPTHFKVNNGIGNNGLSVFFDLSYFSLITFSSVGFGDIVPITVPAKILVTLEVLLRFFVLVFGIANVNRIRVNK